MMGAVSECASTIPSLNSQNVMYVQGWGAVSECACTIPSLNSPFLITITLINYFAFFNRILLETDAPYFQPTVLKKDAQHELSFPGDVWFVGIQIAECRGVEAQEIFNSNRNNISNLYGIPTFVEPMEGAEDVNNVSSIFICITVL